MDIVKLNAHQIPEVAATFLHCLLVRLGGQVTLTHEEITFCMRHYYSTRMAFDAVGEQVTLTLQSVEKENDRGC